MDDKKLFTKILKLKAPWFITKVNTDEELQQIDVWVDHEKNIKVMAPGCDQYYSMYDYAPYRVYRHLNL
mgnify:FL=1